MIKPFFFLSILWMVISMAAPGARAGDFIRLKNKTLKVDGVELGNPSGGAFSKQNLRFLPVAGKSFYLIQFNGSVRPEWKNQLEARGIEINSYLPDDAFIAKVTTPEAWLALNRAAHVKAVLPYDSQYRVSGDFPVVSIFNKEVVQKGVLKVVRESDAEGVLKSAESRGLNLSPLRLSGDTYIIDIKLSDLQVLSEIEGVEWIEPLKEFQSLDFNPSAEGDSGSEPHVKGDYTDLTGYESGTKLMNFDAAYARGFHGEGEVVGISDTGLDRGSTSTILDDFRGQVNKGYAKGLFSKGWEDPQGHGTHTAGSILGTGVTSGGKLRGGAYGARLVEEGLWSPMLNNISINPDFDDLFGRVRREDDVHVHSNSWGSPQSLGSYDNFASLVDEVSWNNPDLLIVFAAGNSGQDLDQDGHIDPGSVGSPGTAKNCLTVGASKNLVGVGGIQKKMSELRDGTKKWGAEPIASSRLSENPVGIAAFSSIGPTQDGRLKPEIVAPGTNIISTRSQYQGASTLWGAYNDFYSYAGGTSMSTPLTAGAAAVVRQALRQQGLADPSAALLKAALLHTATDLFPGQFGKGAGQELATPRPNINEGYGRVDVGLATALDKKTLIDETQGVSTGQSKAYDLEVQPGQRVEATLVYTDAAASAGAAVALVNDLDLTVTDSSGAVFYPNHLNGPDRKNNTEMVEFTANKGGTYKVKVEGHNVPKGRGAEGTQPYALIFTATN